VRYPETKMALVIPDIERLQPYEAGKPVEELVREAGIADAIKLASNENPLGPSPRAIEAIRAAANQVSWYPDAAAYELREKLAARHGVAHDEVVHGNGSNEILDLVVRTFCTSEHHVVFADPSFVVYRLASLAQGVPYTAVPLADWKHDLDAMAAAVTPRTRVVFIANPNNPTGTYVGRAHVERFLRDVPPEVIVVMDEAYIDYADADDFPDGLQLRGLRERLIVTRTFSKIYGLAALRVGYGIGPASLMKYLLRVRQPFSVGSLAQRAAIAALDDDAHVRQSVELNRRERERLAAALTELGFPPPPSQANFLFFDYGRPGRELYEQLLTKGVIVRPFGATPFIRITVGTPAQNDRLLAALREVTA
jgi:histidinol-phosphate aminotransferase